MNYRKMSFLIGEPRLRIGDVEYFWVGLKGVHPNKAKWIEAKGWDICTLTCSLIKSYFWRSKSFPVGRNNLGGSKNAQKLDFLNARKKKLHQCKEIIESFPTMQILHQTNTVGKSYSSLNFAMTPKKEGDDVAFVLLTLAWNHDDVNMLTW